MSEELTGHDKALFKIRVDDSSGLWTQAVRLDSPRSDLISAHREMVYAALTL